ncbi:MAG: fused MFS/spermidine synthase [Thermodesulfobacteriota bacterium]
MLRIAVFALFLGSGMTGLIYQVVWTKLLTLVFGVTMLAVSTVLTSFFGGLALGSWLGGRWIDRHRGGFKWYGMAEALIGVYALIFSVLLGANNSAYIFLAQSSGMSFWGLSLLKFALATILLIIPTTLMGATLPILSKTLARSQSRFAKDIGGLYAINTVGAVAGAVLTAFVLIPSAGMQSILYGTGVLNLAIGAFAYLLGTRHKEAEFEEEAPAAVPATGNPVPADGHGPLPHSFAKILLWGFTLSGFTGLAYEIIWTRVLGFILTGTVYAFAVVLAVFLTGIAAGSFVFSRFIDRVRSAGSMITILAVVEILIGISSMALITLYDKMPGLDFYTTVNSTPVWSEFVYLNFLISFITLILPTFLFGATFPLVCKIYSRRIESVGSKIGNVYSVNTVGGIAGSFAGGFLLIPFVGMQNTIVLMGLTNIAIGAAFILFNPYSRGTKRYALLAVGAAATVFVILILPQNMPLSLNKSFLSNGEKIVYYKEGATATVMIAEKPGQSLSASNKRLWVNGNRATAAYYEGLQINRFQGVLPMILHPDPKDVLVICFGSGTTFGTLSQFPVRMVDNVEIARTVTKGAVYFKKENMDVLNNPKSRINIDDGRSFLAATKKKFDVITEEPMHPSLAGVVNLYTKEYYELAKAHLKPDGIMSQWIPLYNLSVDDMRILVRTFQSVFPHTTIWIANTDIFMIGSPKRTSVDYGLLLKKLSLPNVAALLKDIDLEDPYEYLSTFLMNEDRVRAYTDGAAVMTDNMPVVEFTGPKSLHVNTISPNIGEFLKFREPVVPYLSDVPEKDAPALVARMQQRYYASTYNLVGRAYFADRNILKAVEYFRKALQIDPTDRNSIHYLKNLRAF